MSACGHSLRIFTNDATPVVYADESGNSGSNFMRPEEPLFLSVSTSLSPDEASDLLLKTIGPIKGAEYKYERLSRDPHRHPKRIAGLRSLMDAVAARPDAFAAHVTHKRFALLNVWADVWIYPYLAALGPDPRKNGMSRVLPTLILGLVSECFLNRLLRQFQEMMTARSAHEARAAAMKLFRIAEQGPPIITRECHEVVEMMINSIKALGLIRLRSVHRLAMDVAVFGLLFNANIWKQRLRRPWILCHDKSAHLERYRALWGFLTSADIDTASFPYPSGMVEFPFDVKEIRFERSVDNWAIQLCDVIAGAIRDRLLVDLNRSVNPLIKEAIGHVNPDAVAQGFWYPDPQLVAQYSANQGHLPSMRGSHDWVDKHLTEFLVKNGGWASRW